ncbi:MAG: hypothetical protein U0V70_10955 [Terriglobia bacterium]
MEKARVIFTKCVQDSQEYGSNDEHMVSRLFGYVLSRGKKEEFCVDIKQTVGSNFECDPLEIGRPIGIKGPFNYVAFRDFAEKYFRNCVGSKGKDINISQGCFGRMTGNVFIRDMTFEIEIVEGGAGW